VVVLSTAGLLGVLWAAADEAATAGSSTGATARTQRLSAVQRSTLHCWGLQMVRVFT
jgi:hypothetical protein